MILEKKVIDKKKSRVNKKSTFFIRQNLYYRFIMPTFIE